jgi:hypothetical protein
MASAASLTLASASAPSSKEASAKQWARWSSSNSRATAWSAPVAADTWVQHVDAVPVLLHHALQAADLALDAAQPVEDRILVVDVPGHRAS